MGMFIEIKFKIGLIKRYIKFQEKLEVHIISLVNKILSLYIHLLI